MSIITFAKKFFPDIKSRTEISTEMIKLFEGKKQIRIVKSRNELKDNMIFINSSKITVISKNRDYSIDYNDKEQLIIIDDLEAEAQHG